MPSLDFVEDRSHSHGFDKIAAILALITTLALFGAAWQRFGPASDLEPPALGALAPPLHLRDPSTAEPIALLGLRGKVVWLTFFSAAPPNGPAVLNDLEPYWNRLKTHSLFALAALAVDHDHPEFLRAALAAAKSTLPTYIATPETLQAFGASPKHLPLHILIDPSGQVAFVAQGQDRATLSRLAAQALLWLDDLHPPRHFASLPAP